MVRDPKCIVVIGQKPVYYHSGQDFVPRIQAQIRCAVPVQFREDWSLRHQSDHILPNGIHIVFNTRSYLVHGAGVCPIIQTDASGQSQIYRARIKQTQPCSRYIAVIPAADLFIRNGLLPLTKEIDLILCKAEIAVKDIVIEEAELLKHIERRAAGIAGDGQHACQVG